MPRQPRLEIQPIDASMEVADLEVTTIRELCDRYEQWASETYRHPDGRPTREDANIRCTLHYLRAGAGHIAPKDFSSLHLRHIQNQMADSGRICRTTLNKYMRVMKACIRWGAERRFIPASVYAEASVVQNVKPHRSKAPEPKPIKPVEWERVRATLPFLGKVVSSMVLVQWHSGMRPGELCIMRPCDIDMTKSVWLYVPKRHKTSHHGKTRTIPLGPTAQKLLRPFIATRRPDNYIFSPAESVEDFRLMRTLNRVTPLQWGNGVGTNRMVNPDRQAGEHYTTGSYRDAIWRGCQRAFPHPELPRLIPRKQRNDHDAADLKNWQKKNRWSPNQIRHSVATNLRAKLGIEAARTVLGHSTTRMTEVYAEQDIGKAISAMEQYG